MRVFIHDRALRTISTLLSAWALAGCGTEVCEKNTGPVSEVKVKFKGFNLGEAQTLEIDSTVTGPTAPRAATKYYSRRVTRLAFPESAKDGSATYIFEPGHYIMSLREISNQDFTLEVWLRVYGDTGLLLAEGRYAVSGKTTQCWLNRTMTVSAQQTCSDKDEGDACVGRSDQPWVCKPSGEALACEESICGDGFVDSQNGEACDTADATAVTCAPNCLPTFVDRTLWEPGPQWYQVDAEGPSPRYLAKGAVHAPAGGAAQLVLFGGQDASFQPLGDTWLFDGVAWTRWEGLEAQPSARFGHAMAYDPDREVVLLFGGTEDATSNPSSALHDLWEFDPRNGGWVDVTPTVEGPLSRFGAAMAHHPGDGTVPRGFLIFGGYVGPAVSPHPGRNTFKLEYNSSAPAGYRWQDLGASTVTPTTLRHHTITWVPSLSEMLLIGGQTTESDASTDKVYRFNGTLWENRTFTPTVPKISRHQALVIPDYEDLLLVGGGPSAESATTADRWNSYRVLRGNAWVTILPSNVPPPRTGHVSFYLPTTGALYSFGGRVELKPTTTSPVAPANDTWLLHVEAPPTNDFLTVSNLKIGIQKQTNAPGFYDLGHVDPADPPVDCVATMTLADLDGDGLDEIAMGFPGGSHLGKKLGNVLLDNPNNMDRTVTYTNALRVVAGVEETVNEPWGSWLGGALGAGDINGDGAADLVLGAANRHTENPTNDFTSGALYIIWGGAGGSIPADGVNLPPFQVSTGAMASQHIALNGETGVASLGTPSDRFGYAVAVGDFDSDGLMDIAVGAPERSESESARSTGAVYVLTGAGFATWSTGASPAAVDAIDPAPLILRSTTPGLRLGVSLAAGDVDGDGVSDLVVGSATTSTDATCVAPACGALAVLYGGDGFFGAGGRELVAEALSPSDGALARAGASDGLFGLGGVVAVVDLDSDGRGEVVSALGRPGQLDGGPFAIAIFSGRELPEALAGSPDAAGATHLVLRAPATADRAGFGAFLGAGDVNGDRRYDLLVGAPFEGMIHEDLPYDTELRPVPNAGALYVVLGSRRATYFNPFGDGSNELGVDDLMAWDESEKVTFPMVRVRGSLAEGFLGTSAATSSHFSHGVPTAPRSHTLLFHPGWFLVSEEAKYRNRYEGRVYTVNLQDLLR